MILETLVCVLIFAVLISFSNRIVRLEKNRKHTEELECEVCGKLEKDEKVVCWKCFSGMQSELENEIAFLDAHIKDLKKN